MVFDERNEGGDAAMRFLRYSVWVTLLLQVTIVVWVWRIGAPRTERPVDPADPRWTVVIPALVVAILGLAFLIQSVALVLGNDRTAKRHGYVAFALFWFVVAAYGISIAR